MMSLVFNSSILLVLFVCPLLALTAKEADDRHEPRPQQQASDKAAETGESRATGGLLADPSHTPWLGTAWQKYQYNPKAYIPGSQRHMDGFLLGHSIALPGEYHILHKDTGQGIAKAGYQHIGETAKKVYSWPQHPAEAKVNVFEGPKTGEEFDVSLPKHIKDLGNSPFALFNHNKGTKDVPYPNGKPITKFPNFEHDKNNFGTDCHAHTWSQSPNNLGSSRSELGSAGHGDERYHVKIPVSISKDKCNSEGHCEVHVIKKPNALHGFCRGTADRGAPVLCGKEQKLTYLLAPGDSSNSCSSSASGYHVGHLIPHINAHDSKILG